MSTHEYMACAAAGTGACVAGFLWTPITTIGLVVGGFVMIGLLAKKSFS